jgi:two-component system CheB/CheR fusion protein
MTPDGELNGDLNELLAFLKAARGFDFSGYKRTSLERRISKRMADVGVTHYRDYLDHLQVNPDEFTELFDTILINVTSFFRDQAAWDYLADDVVPQLLESTPKDEQLRVWSAGCASGEEAYTIAMLLCEAMGKDAFKQRVKIYATDVDEDALNTARHATFSRADMKPVLDEMVERYFESGRAGGNGYTFRTDLRRQVIFGRNDLVQDAPISRIDLLVSRNTLMYFTAETQARILGHFNFALNDTGFLFLGKSEMLITHAELFSPYNLKWRVFKRVPRAGLRERLSFVVNGTLVGGEAIERGAELRVLATDMAPVAQVVVDRSGFVSAANQRARELFSLGPADIGRPLQDLEISYRPIDLRSAIERAYTDRRPVNLGRTPWAPGQAAEVMLEIEVTPLFAGDTIEGASVTFADVTTLFALDQERERSKHELETAYDELQSTVEELETTNEELHSTNEELETTNEELQSTNEELETMNEELHSTNEELEAMNDEQQVRTAELDRLNLFLEGILGSLGVGVVVIDRNQEVQVWNASSHDLWGLRAEEVEGTQFMSLDIGLPVKQLAPLLEDVLAGDPRTTETVVHAVTRRGRPFECWVRGMPLRTPAGENYGAILLMADKDSQPAPTAVG